MVGHPWLKALTSFETSMMTKELERKRLDMLDQHVAFRAEIEEC